MLSLSPDLRVVGRHLCDRITGAEHPISSGVQDIVDLLRTPVPIDLWLSVCRQHDISTLRAVEMLQFINSLAGLQRTRNKRHRVQAMIFTLRLLRSGGYPVWLGRRYPGTLRGLTHCCTSGLMMIVPMLLVVLLAWFGAGMLSITSYAAVSIGMVVLMVSTIAHEAVHAIISRQSGSVVCFVRRGLRIGTMHAPLTTRYELLSAIGGPLVGIWISVCCAVLALCFGHALLVPTLIWVSTFHAWSWLPMYGDGVSLLTAWRRRHA